jgi:hypothetical protein
VNVLQLTPAQFQEGQVQLILDLPGHIFRETDPAWRCQGQDPGGDIHPISVHILSHLHHIADMEADPHPDLALGRFVGVALTEELLQRNGTVRRVERAGKFHEERVPGCFDFSPAVPGKDRTQELPVLVQ